MKKTDHHIAPSNVEAQRAESRLRIAARVQDNPVAPEELLRNLGLFMLPQDLKRILFFDEIYRKIQDVHGVILFFGVRWGRDLAILQSLRAIYEPFNYSRRLIGFDSFAGFSGVTKEDGTSAVMMEGAYGVSEGYETFLEEQLCDLEQESPVSHLQKFELVKGDASQTLPRWLKEHPETIVSFAYFDMDIYKPTKDCLSLLKNRMGKGAIVGFDEAGMPAMPGETQALFESYDFSSLALKRSPYSNYESYFTIGE